MTRAPLIRRPPRPRPAGFDDPDFCRFVRGFACIVCYRCFVPMRSIKTNEWDPRTLMSTILETYWHEPQTSPTECAHVGRRGLSQQCPDRECLPLCRVKHHQFGPESHHQLGKRFWSFHGLDRVALIQQLNQIYHRETGK